MRLLTTCFKLSLTICLLFANSPKSLSQIDSAFVSVSFIQSIDTVTTEMKDYMHCVVQVYPLSNFGSMTLSVLESDNGIPAAHFSMSKDELINAGFLSGNTITLITEYPDPAIDYTIETFLLTDSGAYTPKIIDYYEAP